MKRIISCLLIVVMLAVAIPASAGGKSASLELNAPFGVVGQEMAVEIRLKDLPACGGFGIFLEYDADVLKPTSFDDGTNCGLMTALEQREGAYAIAWVDDTTKNPIKGDMVIGTLKFKVKAMPADETTVIRIHDETTFCDNSKEINVIDVVYAPINEVSIYKNHKFADVKNTQWYAEAVLYANKNELMNGLPGNKFEPDSATTRAMLATILYRQEGEPHVIAAAPFTDLTQNWYRNAVNWAFEQKIVKGVNDKQTLFAPDQTITREQIATMMYRYAEYKKLDVSQKKSLASFSDSKKVSDWSKAALQWAYAEGLITGNSINGTVLLDPQGPATRAQIATILMRFIKAHP